MLIILGAGQVEEALRFLSKKGHVIVLIPVYRCEEEYAKELQTLWPNIIVATSSGSDDVKEAKAMVESYLSTTAGTVD